MPRNPVASLARNLRSWRDPPHLHDDDGDERRASWLELLYDLVYIATVIQLGIFLDHRLSPLGALQYAALFLFVWWSWSGTTYYANRFVGDDALRRLLIFLQIFGVGVMATAIPGAFEERGAVFALAYVAVRLLLVLMYLRAYRHVPEARPLLRNYLVGFALGILFWTLSALVAPPWRFLLWGLGIGAEVVVHIAFGTQRDERRVPFHLEHLSERYALFILIVLGDSFIKGIGRVAEEGVKAGSYLFGALATLMIVCLWWTYFDDVALAAVRQGPRVVTRWVYAHLPLAASVVAFGVAVEAMTQMRPDRPVDPALLWLASLSVSGYLLAVAAVDLLTEATSPHLIGLRRVWMRASSAVVLIALPLFGQGLRAWWTIGAIALICLVQVLFDLAVGRERAEVAEMDAGEEAGERSG